MCNETGSYLNFCFNWFSDISLAGCCLSTDRWRETSRLSTWPPLTPKARSSSLLLGRGGSLHAAPHPQPLPWPPLTQQWKVGLLSLGSGEGPDPPLASYEHPGRKGRGAQVQVPCVFSTDPVGRRQGACGCPEHEENASPSSLLGLLWHHFKYRKAEGCLMTAWQGWTSRLPSQPLLAGQDFPVGFGWSREVIV